MDILKHRLDPAEKISGKLGERAEIITQSAAVRKEVKSDRRLKDPDDMGGRSNMDLIEVSGGDNREWGRETKRKRLRIFQDTD